MTTFRIVEQNQTIATNEVMEFVNSVLGKPKGSKFIKYEINNDPYGAYTTMTADIEYADIHVFLKLGSQHKDEINQATEIVRKDYPELEKFAMFPLFTGIYANLTMDKKVFFELLPTAEGKTFLDINEELLKNMKNNPEAVKSCYFNLGCLTSKLHYKILKESNKIDIENLRDLKTPLTHGDLHHKNAMCDIDNKQKVTFIDLEGILESLQSPKTIEEDLTTIFTKIIDSSMIFNNIEIKSHIAKKAAYIELAKDFFKGYISNLKDIEYTEYLTEIFVNIVKNEYKIGYPAWLAGEPEKSETITEITSVLYTHADQSNLVEIMNAEVIGDNQSVHTEL